MLTEEMKAKYESLNSVDDAYALAKEDGYTGTIEDFVILCAKAMDAIPAMDLNDMEQVAGGSFIDDAIGKASDMWDTISATAVNVKDWICENPALTAEIGAGVVGVTATVVGVCYAVSRSRRNNTPANPDGNWTQGKPIHQIGENTYQIDNYTCVKNGGTYTVQLPG